jgi:hypothetical protein
VCVYIHVTHDIFIHVSQIYMIFNHVLDRFQVNKFLSYVGFFDMLETKM